MSRACASANQAITDAADQIVLGHADVVIAGGAESLSNVPILHSRSMSDTLVALVAAKTLGAATSRSRRRSGHATSCRSHRPSPSRRPARRWASRPRRWRRSITSRARSRISSRFARIVSPRLDARMAVSPPRFSRPTCLRSTRTLTTDNGIRDRYDDRAAARAQAGVRPPLRNGDRRERVAAHRWRERRAPHERRQSEGARLRPARLHRSYAYAALDPGEQLLMGPVLAAPVALERAGLTLKDMDLIEMHEAFAAQVLCNLRGFESREWAERAGLLEARRRGGSLEAERDGRIDRHRPSVRRDRWAHPHHALQRARASRRGSSG